MTGFVAIDLSLLPAPDVVKTVSYEQTLQEMIAEFREKIPEFDAVLESEPAVKVLEVAAYFRTLAVQHVNDAARAVMPAYAQGSDLDNIAAIYGVQRLVIVEGNPDALPPLEPVLESDAAFRRRMLLAFEGLSVAGPEGAYLFHALSASADIKDASVHSPATGQVVVTILTRSNDGEATAELRQVVASKLEDARPLSDQVAVQVATITDYSVEASLTVYSGPDSEVVRQRAQESLGAYVDAQFGLGRPVTLSGLYAALHVQGVQNVTLAEPVANIASEAWEAPRCNTVTVTVGGVYDH